MRISAFTTWTAILLGAGAINVVLAQNVALAAELAKVFEAHVAAVADRTLPFSAGAK